MPHDDEMPPLSVIVTALGGVPSLRRHLQSLVPQALEHGAEVIVPFDSTSRDLAGLAREFPLVTFVDMGVVQTTAVPGSRAAAHEIYDRRTASGVRAARGRIIALLQDFGAPAPDWCRQTLEAHTLPHGVIGGAVEHEGGPPLNWAVYFLDFGRYQLPLSEGAVTYLTDINVSYKREVLESVRPLWQDRYKEVTINWALQRQGVVLWRRPQMVVCQRRPALSWSPLVTERYQWGRLFGSLRARESTWPERIAYVVLGPAIPVLLLARMTRKALGGRTRWQFCRAFPWLVAVTLVWCAGEFMGSLTGRESAIPHS